MLAGVKSDEQLYEAAATELVDSIRKGLLAKCMAKSDGDEKKARAMYIRERVKEMKTEIKEEAKREAKKEGRKAVAAKRKVEEDRREAEEDRRKEDKVKLEEFLGPPPDFENLEEEGPKPNFEMIALILISIGVLAVIYLLLEYT